MTLAAIAKTDRLEEKTGMVQVVTHILHVDSFKIRNLNKAEPHKYFSDIPLRVSWPISPLRISCWVKLPVSGIWPPLEVVLYVTKCAFLVHGHFDCQEEDFSWDAARATDCWSQHDSFQPQTCLALLLSSYKAIDYMTWISSRIWQEERWSTGFHPLWVLLRPCSITRLLFMWDFIHVELMSSQG